MSDATKVLAVSPEVSPVIVDSKSTAESYIISAKPSISPIRFNTGNGKNRREINSAICDLLEIGFKETVSTSNKSQAEADKVLDGKVRVDASHFAGDIFGAVYPNGGRIETTRENFLKIVESAKKHVKVDSELTPEIFTVKVKPEENTTSGKPAREEITSI